jgi:hypothetical protein
VTVLRACSIYSNLVQPIKIVNTLVRSHDFVDAKPEVQDADRISLVISLRCSGCPFLLLLKFKIC